MRKNPKRLAPGYTGDGKPSSKYQGYIGDWESLGEVSIDELVTGCNPNWDNNFDSCNIGTKKDYNNNCMNCVVTYDLRVKYGKNVTAKSVGEYDGLKYDLFEAWKGRTPEYSKEGLNALLEYMSNADDQTRIAVGALREESGHAFIMEKHGDSIKLIDPQVGRIYNGIDEIQEYFINQEFIDEIEFMRIDDLMISKKGMKACKAV